jgi:hypothetical protein
VNRDGFLFYQRFTVPSAKLNKLLKEIFSTIASETESYLLVKGLATRVRIGNPPAKAVGSTTIYLSMQDYGVDPYFKNHIPNMDDEASQSPNYSHLISFYLLPVSEDYEMRLQLLEAIVELFEVKPFFHLTIKKAEFELSISMRPVTTAGYEQFWIACQQPSQPVVFYQARVSSL